MKTLLIDKGYFFIIMLIFLLAYIGLFALLYLAQDIWDWIDAHQVKAMIYTVWFMALAGSYWLVKRVRG